MLAKPLALTPHSDDTWEDYVEARTDADYESLDNALDDVGLHGFLDIVAGAFYSRKEHTIHARQSIVDAARRGEAWAIKILEHKYGHAMRKHLHGHPTTFLAGLRHAWSVNFDSRAYTRFLRWHRAPWAASFTEWFKWA